MNAVRAVAFDVGETLIDESRIWARWADRLGVPPFAFMGVLGGVAALGLPHRDAFQILRPDFDPRAEMVRWKAEDPDGLRQHFDQDDLYPDVRPAFAALAALGVAVIIAGNQPRRAGPTLAAMDLGAAAIVISDEIGLSKPDPAFFAHVAEVAGVDPGEVMYVGDRVDNDVRPARAAGMIPVLIRRGPWGYLHSTWPDAAQAAFVVDDLHGVVTAASGLIGEAR